MWSCPNDGMRLPEVGRHQAGGLKLVRLFWCRYCQEGYAVVGESDLYARCVAVVTIDAKTDTYVVKQTRGTQRDFDSVVAALRSERMPRLGKAP